MEILFIMALHGLPVYFTPYFSDSKSTIYIIAGISAFLAIVMGNPTFILPDLSAIGIALYFASNQYEEAWSALGGSHENDAFYEQVAEEITSGNLKRTTWVKCLADSKGDPDYAESLYIKHRVKQLRKKELDREEKQRQRQERIIHEEQQRILEANKAVETARYEELTEVRQKIKMLNGRLFFWLPVSFLLSYGTVFLSLYILNSITPLGEITDHLYSFINTYSHGVITAIVIVFYFILIFFLGFYPATLSEKIPPVGWVFEKITTLQKEEEDLFQEWAEAYENVKGFKPSYEKVSVLSGARLLAICLIMIITVASAYYAYLEYI